MKIVLPVLLCFICSISLAQEKYFVYLQTEDRQPFYVRLNNRLYSSTASGYLILPGLPNGSYQLHFGFPKNEWPLQTVSIVVQNKDLGFILRRFNEKGWGLFNLQNSAVLMSASALENKRVDTEQRTDAFASTLADVVNTPAIKNVERPVENPATQADTGISRLPTITQVVVKADSVDSPTQPVRPSTYDTVAENVVQQSNQQAPKEKETIELRSSKTSDKELNRLYALSMDGKTELVDVSIPTNNLSNQRPDSIQKKEPVNKTLEEGGKFLDIELRNPNNDAGKKVVEPVKTTRLNFNSDCKALAEEKDFIRLRRKMVDESNADGMIETAKKFYKQKCFSSEQIKALCALFLNDTDRFSFLKASYPFVSDPHVFDRLVELLNSVEFQQNFKKMLNR